MVGRICGTGELFGMEDRRSDGWCDGGGDERGRQNEEERLFQRLGDAERKERSVILREEDEGGSVMVMRDDERVRLGG